MSLNNFTTGIIPQIANSTTGHQIYMLSQPHGPFGVQYYLRPYLETPQALPTPQQVQPRIIQQAYQPQQNHTQHQLSLPAPPKPIQVQPPPQSKDQTNAKVRNIKEKCITHYIDGQLIIETSKPLTEKKLKSVKKKKLHLQQQHQPQQQSPHQQQPQPQQPQPQQQQPAPQILQHPIPQQAQPISIQHQLQSHHIPQTIQTNSPQPMRHTPPQPVLKLPQVNNIIKQHVIQQQSPPPVPPPQQQQQQQLPQHQQQQTSQPIQPKQQSHKTSQKQAQNNQHGNNEIQRLRSEMPNWSVAEVVDFIERHEDIRQYSSKFAEDEVDGKALLLMIDRNLNFQILTSMFKHGPAMKIEATLSKYKIND